MHEGVEALLLLGGLVALVLLLGVAVWWADRREEAARSARGEWERLAKTLRLGLILCVIIPALVVYAITAGPVIVGGLVWLILQIPPP